MPPSAFRGNESPVLADGLTKRGFRFAAALFVVAVVWLHLLPRLAQTPAVAEMVARNQALGIDPSAKFYTELPGMPLALIRVESAQRRQSTRPPIVSSPTVSGSPGS